MNKYILFIALLLLPSTNYAALTCRPIASKDGGLPLVCMGANYREELATYANLSELYLLEPGKEESRFIDRVELIADLSENKILIGNGLMTLQINSFLRLKDLKDYIAQTKSRMNLVRASQETFELLKKLTAEKETSYLNTQADLKNFLDAPFIGPAGQVITPEVMAVKDSESDLKLVEAWRGKNIDAISAVGEKDCAKAKATLAKEKDKLTAHLSDLEKASNILHSIESSSPKEPLTLKKGETLKDKAEAIQSSDCDECRDALYFCKARGTLTGFIPPENNCKSVYHSKGCYSSLPESLKVPVSSCLGVKTEITKALLSKKEAELKSKLKVVTKSLDTLSTQSCPSSI